MQECQRDIEVDAQARKTRLKYIVIAHLIVVISFFVASFYWGNFE